ncbi:MULTISPECIES: SRPBCC family protein [unclassified Nocardioides]|uniref:SRPBCC family protein n=1 Tax=unclassified Nocardioides TaxID=2615069 RepID=UPI003623472E
MRISNEFEVGQPIEKVWEFFADIPGVAACLPGADLTEELGDETYAGTVAVRMGPVKLEFAGKAKILERDDATKRMVIDASGADLKGRGQATMAVTAALQQVGRGTRVRMEQDLQLSGAAAQYGRGMISDVTTVLMGQFADNAQRRIDALERGESVDAVAARPASGLSIGLQAARMALMRVFRRFFLPYQPNPS